MQFVPEVAAEQVVGSTIDPHNVKNNNYVKLILLCLYSSFPPAMCEHGAAAPGPPGARSSSTSVAEETLASSGSSGYFQRRS